MTEPKSLRIRDYREVKLDLSEGTYLSWTPAGRAPLRCKSVDISYNADGKILSVEVSGYLAHAADENRRAPRQQGRRLRRSYNPDWVTGRFNVPDWLDELIERYRPTGGAR